MLLDAALGYKSVWRILILFSGVPGKTLSREELRRHTGLGNQSVTRALFILKTCGILNFRRSGKTNLYQLNLADKYTKKIVELCQEEYKDLNALPFDMMNPVREFVRSALDADLGVEKIILFGSVAKRIFRKDSDIDLCVIFEEEYTIKEDMTLAKAAQDIEDRFGRKLQLHLLTRKEFDELEKKKDDRVLGMLRDGIAVV